MRLKTMLLTAALCLPVPMSAMAFPKGDILDLKKPAPGQFSKLRRELGDGRTYSEISLEDKSKVQVALARMEGLLGGKDSADGLAEADKVALFNDQEVVNTVLTKAREDSRLVCRREKVLGSNMPTNRCMTVAERRRRAESDQGNFQRAQQGPGKPNG